jgi:uncharacterized protein involved in type VI secretion and phage assembly
MPQFTSVADGIDWLIQYVKRMGIEGLFHRFYGVYAAKVVANDDPEQRGRIKLIVPVLGSQTLDIWASSLLPGGSTGGIVWVPKVGEAVWVQFENGDPSKPLYSGGKLISAIPSELQNVLQYGFQTPGGHVIRLSEEEGNAHIRIEHSTGTSIELKANGDIEVLPGVGKNLLLGSGAVDTLVKSTAFQVLFNTHTHTSGASGSPTSPPIVGMTAAMSTSTTKAS